MEPWKDYVSWRCALTFPAALRDTSLSTSCQAAPFKNQQSKSMTLPIKLGGSGCKGKVDELLMQFEESAAFKGVDCGQLLARTQTEHIMFHRGMLVLKVVVISLHQPCPLILHQLTSCPLWSSSRHPAGHFQPQQPSSHTFRSLL